MNYFISLFRIIKNGALNFKRNIWLAIASTLIMVVTLVILSILSLLFIVTNASVQTIQERVDISAYFKTGVSESRVLTIRDELNRDARIKEVAYVSSEQALINFKERHKDDALLLESVDELNENPLPATLQIKAYNLEDYPAIADSLNSEKYQEFLDKVNFEDNRVIISRLNSLLSFIITVGLILVGVFSAIAILVIFNTITLAIYNRREEVEIMRLVGATNWYIRGPFIIEALMYSLIATIVTSAMILPIYKNLLPQVSNYISPGIRIFDGGLQTFFMVVLLQLVIAFLLSTISSLLAIRKYLRI